VSSIVQKKTDKIRIHHFDKEKFYTQNLAQIDQISSFIGDKYNLIWMSAHYQHQSTCMKIWSDIAAGKNKRIKLVVKTGGIHDKFTRNNFYPQDGKFIGRVIASSKTSKFDVIQAFNLPPDIVHILYMGVGLDVFDFNKYGEMEDIRKKWGFDNDQIIIGSVGNLMSGKRHESVIKSFEKISEEFNHARLIIAGSGALEKDLKKMCGNCKVDDKVKFTGYHAHIAPIMKMIDILVLAGDREEGIPRVLTEAMAMKTAVVAVNMGSVFELIHDGLNGFLINRKYHGQIENKLRLLFSSPLLLEKMKSHAFDSVQKFDRKSWLKKLNECFLSIQHPLCSL